MKKINLTVVSILMGWAMACPVSAQTSKAELLAHLELATGNYCNYPLPSGHVTPAPEGYEPFYVSHYGRHGARYMTDDDPYKYIIGKLDTAQTRGWLTDKGQEVLLRLRRAAADAWNRDGDLTRLGALQHQGIAHRLATNYPALLMQPHDMYYLTPNDSIDIPQKGIDDPLYEKLDQFRHEKLNGRHQMALLFKDPAVVGDFVDGYQLADGLWNIASDMHCLPELELSFNDLFTVDELIDGFRVYNASWCLWEGLMPGSRPNYYAIYPLLQNFLDEADQLIASGRRQVRLRFGHDSVVLPFAFILGVKEAIHGTDDMENLHNTFAIFRLIPMAGNVQLIFFRKQGSDDILVKFLMNENETSIPIATDCYPFYHWKDVSAHYRSILANANIKYKE